MARRAEFGQHGLEEGEALMVQVEIRQGDAQAFHLNHQHMDVVGTDIVL